MYCIGMATNRVNYLIIYLVFSINNYCQIKLIQDERTDVSNITHYIIIMQEQDFYLEYIVNLMARKNHADITKSLPLH